jgi:PAS domain-containing protein
LAAQDAVTRESEGRVMAIIDSAMDAVIAVDEQERIMVFNAAAEQMSDARAATSSVSRWSDSSRPAARPPPPYPAVRRDRRHHASVTHRETRVDRA